MRLIDADALLKPTGCYNPVKYTYEYGFVVTVDDIKAAETKAERQKGKWEIHKSPVNRYYRCSDCGINTPDISVYVNMNFCPNCGADMRGGQGNDPN